MVPAPLTISCERCHSEAVPEVGSASYCLECGLYVCAACWRSRSRRCVTCASTRRRTSRATDLRLLRRWDRRLREVRREAVALDAVGAAGPTTGRARDRASQALKLAAIGEAGTPAMKRQRRRRQTSGLRSLAERIGRHEAIAQAALERLDPDSATPEAVASSAPPAAQERIDRPQPEPDLESASHRRTERRRIVLGLAAVFASAAVLLAILAPRLADGPSAAEPGEGVLGGVPSGSPSASALVEPPSLPQATAGASSTPDIRLAVDFDDLRMGHGIGDDWSQTSGATAAVELAAYPTAVNRSARLTVVGGEPVEACRDLEEINGSAQVSLDVRLAPHASASAEIRLLDAERSLLLSIVLAPQVTAVTGPDGPAGETAGLEPGGWYRVEVMGGSDELVVQVSQRGGATIGNPVAAPASSSIGMVCLAASGESGAAVNYDNLAVASSSEEG